MKAIEEGDEVHHETESSQMAVSPCKNLQTVKNKIN
jgi:hypothetical protein